GGRARGEEAPLEALTDLATRSPRSPGSAASRALCGARVLTKARGPATQYRRNAGPLTEILVITPLLLIACFVGLLAAKPWAFVLGAVALLLLHPLALLLAL